MAQEANVHFRQFFEKEVVRRPNLMLYLFVSPIQILIKTNLEE